jgi:predicted ATP-grasp superfamily ATP-dependent carboligase
LRILILEYASASGINDPSICTEGYAMLEGIIEDFKSKNADYLLWHDSNFNNRSCHCIKIDEDLMTWLDRNINLYDACILIAPEEDLTLFKLTELIEKKNVQVIGSSSKAVYTCSNKYETYKALKDKFNIIRTEKVFFDEIDNYNTFIKGWKVIKPTDGVSCSGVKIIDSSNEFQKAVELIQSNLPYFIVQDFIEGTSASVSLLSNGDKAMPLSLNSQNIKFEGNNINYSGGYVPLKHELEYDAKKIAKKAVESINGLKGYVGVDVILGEKVHIVEINPRITTPYVALKNIINFNLGEAIFNSVNGKLPLKINLNGKISFHKEKNDLKMHKLENF